MQTDAETIGFWGKALAAAASLVAATVGAVKLFKVALDAKADKEALDAAWKEIEKRRDVEAKIFDQIREHEHLDNARFERTESANRDRHDELMALIGDLRADIARNARR